MNSDRFTVHSMTTHFHWEVIMPMRMAKVICGRRKRSFAGYGKPTNYFWPARDFKSHKFYHGRPFAECLRTTVGCSAGFGPPVLNFLVLRPLHDHVGGNPTAGTKASRQLQPARVKNRYQIINNCIGYIFVKNPIVSKTLQIQL